MGCRFLLESELWFSTQASIRTTERLVKTQTEVPHPQPSVYKSGGLRWCSRMSIPNKSLGEAELLV